MPILGYTHEKKQNTFNHLLLCVYRVKDENYGKNTIIETL